MSKITVGKGLSMLAKGMRNLALKKPLAVSFEITHSCNCNCQQCDKGGRISDEILASPSRFGELAGQLRPVISQISGGEPLLREDIDEIITEVRTLGKPGLMVLVTNAELLTEDRYLHLKEMGIDEFSISLDFPDERHDKNRRNPGLYRHLDELLPRLASHGHRDITLISVIREQNLEDLPAMAEQALRWNISINFSAYTTLRTHDASLTIRPERLALLRKQIDYLIEFKKRTGRLFTPVSVLNRYYEFFANGGQIPGCRAGIRCLVINPDGNLAPCAMFHTDAYPTQKELIENFSATNTCGGCYVSMRANAEKSIGTLLKDAWGSFKQFQRD
jgi:MoaA/NifB/PqqE/SkfB family radical SAM enzyme